MKKTFSRRTFLKKSAAATASAIGAPMIVPSSVLGKDGATAPSNRITMALIGHGKIMGGHRGSHLGREDVQVLAVCDVDRKKREQARDQVERKYSEKAGKDYKGCGCYNEHERIMDRDDIDAVVVGTPDHWHAGISIDAMKSGKDVYVEKPMTLTVREGQVMVDVAKRYGRILQVGSQQRSNVAFRKIAEIVRNGWIGKVHTIYASLGNFPAPHHPKEEAIPEGFDYDRWLGPTPWFPYSEERVKGDYGGGWRRFWEYGSRKNGDWGVHHFDIIQWALGMDDSGPVEYIPKGYKGTQYQTHIYGDGTKVLRNHPVPDGFAIHFIGTEGEAMVNRGGRMATRPDDLTRVPAGVGDERLYVSNDHRNDWLEGIRTRRQPICNVEVGHRSSTICLLSGIAERLGRPVQWDPKEEKIKGDKEASRWLDRPRRAPYYL